MEKIIVCFEYENGNKINVQGPSDMIFAELTLKFCQKCGIDLDVDDLIFIFNSQ